MWASDVIIIHFEDELKDENYQQAFIMHGDFQYRITNRSETRKVLQMLDI